MKKALIKMDEIIVGTYEGFLLGYSKPFESEDTQLKQTFATHSHTSAIRCVDAAGKFLASGGIDDKIIIVDLKTRKEHTVLMNHDGTINTLKFTNNGTHLLSGSSDGTIIVTRVGNWQIEKIWKKAHGGSPVNAIAVHPSDKLALSIGGDKTLRTWNLVKGRPAFTINLSSKGINLPTELAWAPEGDRFSLISQQIVDVWTISKAGMEKRITCTSKPTCMTWISNDIFLVGLENGNVLIVNVTDGKALTCKAHKERVKCLFYEKDTLYSTSSSGEIKVWNVTSTNTLSERFVAKAGCRITCLTINHQTIEVKKEEESDTEEVAKSEAESDLEVNQSKGSVSDRGGAYVSIKYGSDEDDDGEPKPKKKKKNRRSKKKKPKKDEE